MHTFFEKFFENIFGVTYCLNPICHYILKEPGFCFYCKCILQGCNLQRKHTNKISYLFCEKHSCNVSQCFSPAIKYSFEEKYCLLHSCQNEECTSINTTNTKYCSYHLCNANKCQNQVVKNGHNYCELHGCYQCGDFIPIIDGTIQKKICNNCKCSLINCYQPKETYLFCYKHRCMYPMCKFPKYGKNFCQIHKCSNKTCEKFNNEFSKNQHIC